MLISKVLYVGMPSQKLSTCATVIDVVCCHHSNLAGLSAYTHTKSKQISFDLVLLVNKDNKERCIYIYAVVHACETPLLV